MDTPPEILAIALQRANTDIGNSIINNQGVRQRLELICRNIRNKALSRLILSCCLAKIHKPQIDIRKNANQQRIETLLAGVQPLDGAIPLSSESIIAIIQSHLVGRNSSRLPVLIVTAADKTASLQLGEQAKVLASHNAADKQTGTIGDIEITLINDEQVLTGYE